VLAGEDEQLAGRTLLNASGCGRGGFQIPVGQWGKNPIDKSSMGGDEQLGRGKGLAKGESLCSPLM